MPAQGAGQYLWGLGQAAWRAAWGRRGGRAEDSREGGMGAHRDRAEPAVRNQQLRARTGASAAAAARGTGGGGEKRG